MRCVSTKFCNTVAGFAIVFTIEALAVTASIMVDVDYVVLKTAAIVISLLFGLFCLAMFGVELSS